MPRYTVLAADGKPISYDYPEPLNAEEQQRIGDELAVGYQPAEAPEGSEGLLGGIADFGRGVATGVAGLPDMASDAWKFLDRNFGDVEPVIEKPAEESPMWMRESQAGLSEEDLLSLRGQAYESGEMAAQSVGPAAAGAIAGAGVGAVFGGLGAIPGAALGAGIGFLGTIPLFAGSQGEETYKRAYAHGVSEGMGEEEAHTEALKAGQINAAIEAGGEVLADVVTMRLARLLPKKVKGELVKSLLTNKGRVWEAIKEIGGKVIPAEVSTEIGQAVGQTYVESKYAGGEDVSADTVKSVLIPTVIMSVLTGGGASVIGGMRRAELSRTLSDPTVPKNIRADAAARVGAELDKHDPEIARMWRKSAEKQILKDEPVVAQEDAFYQDLAQEDAAQQEQAGLGAAYQQQAQQEGYDQHQPQQAPQQPVSYAPEQVGMQMPPMMDPAPPQQPANYAPEQVGMQMPDMAEPQPIAPQQPVSYAPEQVGMQMPQMAEQQPIPQPAVQPQPTPKVKPFDARLTDPVSRESLAGIAQFLPTEEGLIPDIGGKKVTPVEATAAVQSALAGEKRLSPRQKRIVTSFLDAVKPQQTQEQPTQEQPTKVQPEVPIVDVESLALQANEQAARPIIEQAATGQLIQDDERLALQDIIGRANEQQAQTEATQAPAGQESGTQAAKEVPRFGTSAEATSWIKNLETGAADVVNTPEYQDAYSQLQDLRRAEPVMKKDGSPYKSRRNAQTVLNQRKLTDTHEVQEVDGGFAGVPKQVEAPSEGVEAKDQSDARILSRSLKKYFKDNDYEYTQVELPDALSGIGEAYKSAFSKRIAAVVPSNKKGNFFNGVRVPTNKDVLYLNANSEVSWPAVIGHELLHDLKAKRPDLYAYLAKNAREHFKNFEGYQDRLNALLKEGEKEYTAERAEEELLADFLGDALTDPVFLDKLAKDNPSKFKKLLHYITLWLAKVKKQLGHGSEQYAEDVESIRRYLREVLNAYSTGGDTAIADVSVPKFSVKPMRGEGAVDVEKMPASVRKIAETGRWDMVQAEPVQKGRPVKFDITPQNVKGMKAYSPMSYPSGKESTAYYDPKYTTIEERKDDDFTFRIPRLKKDSGLSERVPAKKKKGVIYRGMSVEEYENFQDTGRIQTKGDYNFEHQKGTTSYSVDPEQAESYSAGLAPVEHTPAFGKSAYIVAVNDPSSAVNDTRYSNERTIQHAIEKADVLDVYEGVVYAISNANIDMKVDYEGGYGGTGSGVYPSVSVGWRKLEDPKFSRTSVNKTLALKAAQEDYWNAFPEDDSVDVHNAKVEVYNTLMDDGYISDDLLYALKTDDSNMIEQSLEKAGDMRTFDEIVEEHEGETTEDQPDIPNDVFEIAKLSKGVTEDLNETGYILPDGVWLDFSGKKDGGPAGTREEDHRQLGFALGGDSGTSDMINFQQMGAVRVDARAGSADMEVMPTGKQLGDIEYIIERNDGGSLDLNDGSRSASVEIQNPSKVRGIIRRFYDGEDVGNGVVFSRKQKGDFSEKDEIAFSRKVEDWAKDRWGNKKAPNGNPIWQNFTEWFGDSKVVNEDGTPMEVYHGSIDSFEAFKTEATREFGAHFATDRTVTRLFAGKEGGEVYDAYLSLQNPLDLVSDLGDWADLGMWKEYLPQLEIDGLTQKRVDSITSVDEVKSTLRELGFDGVMYENAFEQGDSENYDDRQTYIAFDPEQIKSSVGNQGDFSQTDNRIAFSRKPDEDRKWANWNPSWTKADKLIGAPEQVNKGKDKAERQTRLTKMKRLLRKLVLEGLVGRMWYEDSARAVMKIVKNDIVEAEKFIQLLAIYSPQSNIDVNTGFAIKAYNLWKNDVPRKDFHVKTGNQDGKAVAALYDDKPFDIGRKTAESFYPNLMHELLVQNPDAFDKLKLDTDVANTINKPATIDMWMYRAFGYKTEARGNDLGGGAYSFAENYIRKFAAEMNRSGKYEGRVLPHQVQAMIWTAMKARYEIPWVKAETDAQSLKAGISYVADNGRISHEGVSAEQEQKHRAIWRKVAMTVTGKEARAAAEIQAASFEDHLERNTRTIMTEAVPSADLGLEINSASPNVQQMFTAEAADIVVDESGVDLLASEMGVPLAYVTFGEGAFEGAVTPNMLSHLLLLKMNGVWGRDEVRTYASAMQYIYKQKAVPWMRPDNRVMLTKGGLEAQRYRVINRTTGKMTKKSKSMPESVFDSLADAQKAAKEKNDALDIEKAKNKGKGTAKARRLAREKGFEVLGGNYARVAVLTFKDDLSRETELKVLSSINSVLGEYSGFTKTGRKELGIVNFRDDKTHVPEMSDEDFLSALNSIDGALKSAGVSHVGKGWVEGEYGHVQDWKADTRGRSILRGASLGSPVLQQRIRGWAGEFEQLIKRYSGSNLKLREQEAELRERYEEPAFSRSNAGSGRGLRGIDGGVETRYGTPQENSVSVLGIHYSKQKRESLSGAYYGTGIRGAESVRLAKSDDPQIKSRIHYYVDTGKGVNPETGAGAYAHATQLDNLYNTDLDQLNLRALNPELPDDLWFNEVESAIVKAGFDGVYVPQAQANQGVAVLMGTKHTDVPVEGVAFSRRTDDGIIRTAVEAEQLISDAYNYEDVEKDIVHRVLFHSGVAKNIVDIEQGIEPQIGPWVSEVLAGSGYLEGVENESYNPEDDFIPVAFYDKMPNWVRMQVGRKLDKSYSEVTENDIREHGYLAIVDNIDRRSGDANYDTFEVDEMGGQGEGTKGIDQYGFNREIYETSLYDSDWKVRTPYGLEPGDIVTDETIVPDAVLTGDELIAFMRRQKEKNPDIRFSRISPHLETAREKIGKKSTWRDTWDAIKKSPKAIAKEHWKSIEQGLFDTFASFKNAQKEAGLDLPMSQDGYVAMRLSTSVADRLAVLLKHAQMEWKDGVLQPIKGTQGFLKVLEPVKDSLDEFGMYLAGLRAKEIEADNKKSGFTKDEIDAMVGLRNDFPAFEGVRLAYMEINKSVLDLAQEAGLINPVTRPMWESDNYLPFYRIMEDGSVQPRPSTRGTAGQRSGIRQLRGSDRNIGDPLENIMMNWAHLLDASVKNHAARMNVDNFLGTGLIKRAGATFKKRRISAEDARQRVETMLDDAGLDPDTADLLSSAPTLKGLTDLWSMEAPAGDDIIRIMRDGKAEYYHVYDPLMFRSFTALNQQHWGGMMAALRYPKRLLTQMVTADPAFMARNYLRDTMSAWVLGRDNFTIGIDSVKGAAKAFRTDWDMVRYMAAGGTFSSGGYLNAHDPAEMKRFITGEMSYKTFEKTLLNTPKRMWDFWQHLGASIENANRVAVGLSAEAGGKGLAGAAYEMKDVMDFSMRGDYAAIQFLAETVPFFAARLQGLHRLGRGAAENPKAFAAKGSLIMGAAIALYMMNKDDDRFKELEDWDRDTYFHFFVGEEHFRLPKPFEIGVLFGTMPERMVEAMIDEDKRAADFFERFRWNFSETLAMNPTPQAVRPLIEQWANKSAFTGRPLVGMRLENMAAEAQYEPWTSETTRALGKMWGISPKRAEALIRGYFGTIGMYGLAASDTVMRSLGDYPPEVEKGAEDYALLKSFYRGKGPAKNTRYVTKFYEMTQEVNKLQTAINEYRRQGEKGKASALREENIDKLRSRKVLNKYRGQMTKINKVIRRVHYSRTMSPPEKKERLLKLIDRRNAIAERGVKRAKK